MRRQCRAGGELPGAQLARVRPLPGVSSEVVLQVVLCRERRGTRGTLKRPLARVQSPVPLQDRELREGLGALLAPVGPFAGVGAEVDGEGALVSEGGPAAVAREWAFARVGPEVRGQVGTLQEPLGAVAAAVQALELPARFGTCASSLEKTPCAELTSRGRGSLNSLKTFRGVRRRFRGSMYHIKSLIKRFTLGDEVLTIPLSQDYNYNYNFTTEAPIWWA